MLASETGNNSRYQIVSYVILGIQIYWDALAIGQPRHLVRKVVSSVLNDMAAMSWKITPINVVGETNDISPSAITFARTTTSKKSMMLSAIPGLGVRKNATSRNQRGHNRSVTLDLCRILTALWVLCLHWTGHGHFWTEIRNPYPVDWVPYWFNKISTIGHLRVDFFFMLSGIVISRSVLDRSWQDFVKSRFLRLYPAYAFTALIAIALSYYTLKIPLPISQTWVSVTGLHSYFGLPNLIGPAWTLFIEMRFYMLIAILIILFGTAGTAQMQRFAYAWIFCLVLAPSLNLEWFNFLVIPEFGPYFALGIILGTCTNATEFRKQALPILVASAVSLVRLVAGLPTHYLSVVIGIMLIVFTITVTVLSTRESVFNPSGGIVKFIAQISLMTYPLYLLHETVGIPITGKLFKLGTPIFAAISLSFVCMILLSFITARFVEPAFRNFLLRTFYPTNKTAELPEHRNEKALTAA